MLMYLIGSLISGLLWYGILRLRLKGFKLKMPGNAGYLLTEINKDDANTDWSMMIIGILVFILAWPVAWFFLVSIYSLSWLFHAVGILWSKTLGDENLAKKIFGVKK